jgi:hypothetical protein
VFGAQSIPPLLIEPIADAMAPDMATTGVYRLVFYMENRASPEFPEVPEALCLLSTDFRIKAPACGSEAIQPFIRVSMDGDSRTTHEPAHPFDEVDDAGIRCPAIRFQDSFHEVDVTTCR